MENLRGAKIVKQDSSMVENSHLYIKAKDENYCELTILDENGKKRKVGAWNEIYAENPQTLINLLNNCNSTQLNEIKTLLGII